jgi:hypothetical protein
MSFIDRYPIWYIYAAVAAVLSLLAAIPIYNIYMGW